MAICASYAFVALAVQIHCLTAYVYASASRAGAAVSVGTVNTCAADYLEPSRMIFSPYLPMYLTNVVG